MLLLSPERVRFATQVWPQVRSVAISRLTASEILDWNDRGPHAVFADAARQSTRVRIIRGVAADDLHLPVPGSQGDLEIRVREGAGDGGVAEIRCVAVLTGISYRLSARDLPERMIDLVALSTDGRQDPITITRIRGD
jgi:hypothetical protein